jgi:hypothetical protein
MGKTMGRTLGQTTGRTFATTGRTFGQTTGRTFGQPMGQTVGKTFGQPMGRTLATTAETNVLNNATTKPNNVFDTIRNFGKFDTITNYANKPKDLVSKVKKVADIKIAEAKKYFEPVKKNKSNGIKYKVRKNPKVKNTKIIKRKINKVKNLVNKGKKYIANKAEEFVNKAKQGTKNYINSSQMKIKFNNFIQSVKNKYKDFSEKFLEGFKNNFNFALKEKLINNNKLSYLLEIADGIKNQIKLKSYLKTINDYLFNLALNSKGRLEKFVSNLKVSLKFLNSYTNKILNLDKIINNIKNINLKIFIIFLKHFDLLMTLSLVYFTTEIIIKNYDQQLKINAYKKLIKEISSKLGENENKDNLEKLLEINDSMYLVISKGGYINKYKNSENKNSNILNLQKEIVQDINENIFNRNDKMITRLKSLQNEIYDIEKEKEKNVALRTYEILKSKFSEKVLNNKSFDKLTPAQINERNLFLESSHILLSS